MDGTGADGDGLVDDAAWPLHMAIDLRALQAAVIGMLDDYFFIGSGMARRRYLSCHNDRTTQLMLRINRPDRKPSATDAFRVTVRVWGPARDVAPTGRFVWCADHDRPKNKNKGALATIGGFDPQGRRW